MPGPSPTGSPLLPPGFVLGVGTAAYAVEGAVSEGGRGPSDWDVFSHEAGRTQGGATGDVAADHHRRWREDLALVEALGVGGYRFSVAWSRVQPDGRGPALAAGLDHYDRVIDRLLELGVEPMVTVHHWDLPQGLQADGGWLNPATAHAFADYAAILGERFADRVARWVPLDQPNVLVDAGYSRGVHAPGYRFGMDALPAAHQLLLGHGRAVQALRAAGARGIGCATNHAPIWPASDEVADVAAAKLYDSLWNGLWVEAMLTGRYPVDVAPLLEEVVRPGDLAVIRQPLDFYGVSYDAPIRVAATPTGSAIPFGVGAVLGHEVTEDGVPVVPQGLREWLITLRARFRSALPPLVVTAVGCAQGAEPGADGEVDDQPRIEHLEAHLHAVAEACRRGVEVSGFYAWSLLDGFSWDAGYCRRTGLVHVDRTTLRRTPKRSFAWYADLIAAQPAGLG